MAFYFIISGIVSIIIISLVSLIKRGNISSIRITIFPYWVKLIGIIFLIFCSLAPSILPFDEILILSGIRDLVALLSIMAICLSGEKNRNENYDKLRLIALTISLFSGILVCQILVLFSPVELKEFSFANFSFGILAVYLIIFYWYKGRYKKLS